MLMLGLFAGALCGYAAHCLLCLNQWAEVTAACHACHAKHMQALLRAGVDTRWETGA
jgi:formate dehydrogenase maturation protein FdhE